MAQNTRCRLKPKRHTVKVHIPRHRKKKKKKKLAHSMCSVRQGPDAHGLSTALLHHSLSAATGGPSSEKVPQERQRSIATKLPVTMTSCCHKEHSFKK